MYIAQVLVELIYSFFCITCIMKVLIFILVCAFEFNMAVSDERFERQSNVVTRPYIKGDKEAGAQTPLIVKVYDGQRGVA